VLSPDGTTLFVSNGRARSVSVIDVAGRKVARTLNDVGQRPWGIGIDAAGTKIFTANGPAGDVSIIDVATGAVQRRISLGGSPWGIAVATAP
jgi:YVTN family beta-propeller protein